MRNRKYIVDLNSKTYQVARYKQYDNNINYSIEVIEDGVLVDLDNCIVKAFFETPSKLILQKDCMVSDNTITTILDNNILGEAGKVLVEFTVYKDDIIVTTFTLSLDVEKSINKNDAIQKEPVWDIIANLLKVDETVRVKLEEVDNKIIETTEITNTNTSKIDNKILDIQNQLDSRISEKFTEIDNTLESKTTEKFIAVDEILNEKQTQIQEQVDNKISDADNKILDCEERMQIIESNFDDLVDGTGYATTEFVNRSLEQKSNIDHRHNISEIDDLNMNAEDISMSDGSNVEENVYRNKENIQYIKNELSKTENTSYTTENGVKEFECKNGYVDNVVIEGKTLVNLANPSNIFVSDGVRYLNGMKYAKPNTLHTIINFSDKRIGYTDGGIAVDIGGAVEGKSSKTFTTSNTITLSQILIYGHTTNGWGETEQDKQELKQSIVILEGDHTDKPISYFEGLKSVGQGDKIEVLTKNSDETKQDKKQILTTLRSLPNGVKDTIEKRGNKYYKIKRCYEGTLLKSQLTLNTGKNGYSFIMSDFGMPNIKPKNIYNVAEGRIVCNKLKEGKEYGYTIENGGIYHNQKDASSNQMITIATKGTENINEFTIVYELETPIIEELPNFNPQTFSDKTTLLLNSGVVQAEASFEVTNSLGSELEVLKGKSTDIEEGIINNLYGYQKWKLTNDNSTSISIDNTDFDLITKSGKYTTGANCTNKPMSSSNYFYLEVSCTVSGNILQQAYDVITSGYCFYRIKHSGVWKPWQRLSTTSTLSLLEQQISELEIQLLENEV